MKAKRMTGVLITLFSGLFLCGSALAQISGTEHDFSGQGWSGGEICVACHAAHNTDDTVSADAPLWNHELSTATYTLYTGFDLQGTAKVPATATKLCLSCHDGTVAVDSFGGNTGTTFVTGDENLGTDLSNDHPVSIDYNVADTGLHDPSTTPSGIAGGTTIDADMLVGGEVECSSCHDVHNEYNVDGLLVKSNAASGLCLTCHDK